MLAHMTLESPHSVREGADYEHSEPVSRDCSEMNEEAEAYFRQGRKSVVWDSSKLSLEGCSRHTTSFTNMAPCRITFEMRGISPPGEVFAICGSCNALGNWNPQCAVILQPEDEAGDVLLWKATVDLPRGKDIDYRYFQGTFLEPQTVDGPCQVIIHKWETHLPPRSITPLEDGFCVDDGHFGIFDDVESVDSGWLTCQTEIRLRLHFSQKPPVSITKKKFKKSRFRVKLTLEGLEEEGEDEEDDRLSPTIHHKMANTLEISLISDTEFKSRHSQPECGYGLQADRWTEYTIQTMEPDNLELIFDFFEEDLSEAVIQGDALPGHVGSACLLSSTIAESGKSCGILTLPIMNRISRKTIGKVRVDYIIIRPIQGYFCDMEASYAKYWRERSGLDVGHRGAGNSTTTTKLAKLRENTVASLKNAARHGAAFVEFDVHLSRDHVPIIYHDLTCCIAMKKKDENEPLELFEIAVKELTFAQLQLLKLAHVTALKSKDSQDLALDLSNLGLTDAHHLIDVNSHPSKVERRGRAGDDSKGAPSNTGTHQVKVFFMVSVHHMHGLCAYMAP
ncbi:Glycerophosphocholine phosphodiesterase GPCPD1 [Varanus komodoensis]|nr:Glycerophosphocholine phosphodiesterase GPCPD1 [Varanus komodoensis]